MEKKILILAIAVCLFAGIIVKMQPVSEKRHWHPIKDKNMKKQL